MKRFDLHCDTFYEIYKSEAPVALRQNNLHIDLEKLKAGKAIGQCFALYIDAEEEKRKGKTLYQVYQEMLALFKRELTENASRMALLTSYEEIEKNMAEERLSALLAIEEGGVLEGDLDRLASLYQDGVRLITLTWNYPNEIGFPNLHPLWREQGLTDFGHQVVEEMNNLGMVVDVSHLSDQGFQDVLEVSRKPFIASHSNARTIFNHPRNLTDSMIRALANQGGVMGINFFSKFLGTQTRSTVSELIQHIKHIRQVGGIEVLALGTDFDGISCPLEIEHYGQLDKLTDALLQNHFTESEIEKFCCQNVLRVLKDTIPLNSGPA